MKYKPDLIHGRWQDNQPKKADLVIADPPYGITGFHWDTAPDMVSFMEEMLRLTGGKPVIVFGCQPFSSLVVQAAVDAFKYEIVWEKHKAVGHLQAKNRPMRAHENVLIFYTINVYNPQMRAGKPFKGEKKGTTSLGGTPIYGHFGNKRADNAGTRYPRSVMKIQSRHRDRMHGTQKPLALLGHLIKTHSNEGDLVFDPFGGSGSTGIAAMLTGRRSIVTEADRDNSEASVSWLNRIMAGEEPGR